MAEGFDQRYERTRVQLHGLAEGLIAGPQYRSAGTIRLAVYADGFGGVVSPLSIRGGRFDWVDGSAPLAGTPRELARAAGVDFGAPEEPSGSTVGHGSPRFGKRSYNSIRVGINSAGWY